MQLLPNETIPSFMARTQLLAIHRRVDSFYQSILDCSYTQTCGVATYRLEKLSQLLGIDLERLIMEHTAYPYFAHYMSEKHAKSLRDAISGDKPKVLEIETGSVNSRLSIPSYHSFCPLCAEDDIENHGVAYWHQLHALPGVSACHIHKCKLIRTEIRAKILAIPDLNQAETREASDKEVLFAQLSAKLCQNPSPNLNPAITVERYKQKLNDAGYISEQGHLRRTPLLSGIRNFWSDLLKSPDFHNLKTNGNGHNFVRDVLKADDKRTHPVKHTLLAGFLDFATHQRPRVKPESNVLPKTDMPEGNQEHAVKLLKQGVALSRTAKESGVSYYTVRKLAKEFSINHRTRRKKITPEQEEQTLELLKTGLSMKKIGEQVGLAESTVDNLLLSHPDIRAMRRKLKKTHHREKLVQLRNQALSLIENNPDMSRKSLVDSFPEVFIWLRNHDKEWLYKHLPQAQSATQAQAQRYKHHHGLWKQKQRKAIKGLRSFAIKSMDNPPKNQRLSPSYILKALKVRNTQSHIRKTMPAFWRQLTRYAESHEDFQLRKLHALYNAEPALFTIYSARRLLKIAAAFPPVSEVVLGQAQELQKNDLSYQRPVIQLWLLFREVHSFPVQEQYFQSSSRRGASKTIIAFAVTKRQHVSNHIISME